jgi:hypothetical protein
MVGSGRSPTAKRSSPSSFNFNRSATADFRAIKILLDTCGTSRARPNQGALLDRETRAMKVLTRGLSPGPGIRLRRFVPDSPLEQAGFELVWGFSCQVVVLGLAESSLFGAGKPFFIPSPAIRFAERAEGVKGPKR